MDKKRFQKIYIEISNICNLKCSFCKETKRIAKIMDETEFRTVIMKVKEYTNLVALHVKGEPLMHPKLQEILKICEENGVLVNITTNGTLLYENINILRQSKALRQINISLHSMNKHNGKLIKSLDKYMQDIFKSVQILNTENKPYISYRLWNLKNLKENDENFEILKALEEEYKIENLKEKAMENDYIKMEEKIFLNQDIEFSWPDINGVKLTDNGTCLGLRNQIAILSNGDVVPCCLDQDADIKLGNIFEEELEEIINTEKSKKIIEGFEQNKFIHKLCKTCGFASKFKKE